MHISNSACWLGAVPEAVHLKNDQSEGAVRDILQGHLSGVLVAQLVGRRS